MFFVTFISSIHDFTYIETTAVVVDVKYEKEKSLYYPIYEYNFNGKIVRAEGFPQSNRDKIVIGDMKSINYNPKNYRQFDEGARQDGLMIFGLSILFLSCSIPGFIGTFKMLKLLIKGNEYSEL